MFLLYVLIIVLTYIVYYIWGTIPCLFFLICLAFTIILYIVDKVLKVISEEIEAIKFYSRRLGTKIEHLEDSLNDNDMAKKCQEHHKAFNQLGSRIEKIENEIMKINAKKNALSKLVYTLTLINNNKH